MSITITFLQKSQLKVTIKQAMPDDAAAIAELSGQLGYASEIKATSNRLSAIMKEDSSNCVFVAVYNSVLIGWIHGFYAQRIESDPFVEIGGLVVEEHYRKMGAGKLLVENVMNWALSKNCSTIRVRCNIKRVETHIFYKKIGFQLSKQQKIFDLQLEEH